LGSATAASARTLSAACPDANGPAYAVAGRATHLYVVEVRGGVSCAFADSWVSKLAAQPRLGPLHGPAGWNCIAASKTDSRLAVFGGCGPGRFKLPALPAKGFGWYPDTRAH
jgi:hypothetical protein